MAKSQPKLTRKSLQVSRSLPVPQQNGKPTSLNEAERSVEFVASTEEPVMVMDWERCEPVMEVLLMSGCKHPPIVPLLDSHSRYRVSDVIGSFRNIRLEQGPSGSKLVGKAIFSATEDGDKPFQKVQEGHVTDVSVGYSVKTYIWVEEGQTYTYEGKTYTGPMRISTEWELQELSLCPIGADSNAKVRNKTQQNLLKEKRMGNTKRAGLIARLRAALGLRAETSETEEKTETQEERQEEALLEAQDLTEEELVALVEDIEELVQAAAPEEEEEQDQESADRMAASRAARARSGFARRSESECLTGREAERYMKEEAAGERKGSAAGSRVALAKGSVAPARKVSPANSAKLERARILGIRNLASAHNLAPEMETRLINSGVSLQGAKSQVLDMLVNRQNNGPGFHVSVGTTEMEKYRAAVQDSLSMRCGHAVEKPAPGATELRSFSLREIAREMLARTDRSGKSVQGDIREIVGRALSTTDLPMIMVEVSRRSLMQGFEAPEETWRAWAETGIATDFKTSTAIGMEGDVKPVFKPEGGEYTEGRLAEHAEEYKIRTYGRKMTITREAIINDDLSALSDLPRMYGLQTAAMVGDVAYEALIGSVNMGDGKPLFCAEHGNLYSNKGGLPTVEKLGALVTGMKLQKDSFGNPLTVIPRFFLAPVAMETACEQFFNTQLNGMAIIGTQAMPLQHNPYGGNFFTRVYDRRLDAKSASNWFLAARMNTVKVFFLGGVEAPYIESQINFNTDGMETKIRMDVGAKAMSWLGFAKAVA